MPDRRTFLTTAAAVTGAALLQTRAARALRSEEPAPIACNQYTWFTYYRREGQDWLADLDASLGVFTRSGLRAYEPSFDAVEEVERLGPLLTKHGVRMRSLYVNSTLHEADRAEASIAAVLAIAEAARPLGAEIIVTNPSPIRWGGPENKTDAQLRTQAQALDRLGAALRRRGLTLAYHNHDPELRQGARELHHMLVGTDPAHVTYCLDTHWVFRGAGDSQVALFDVVQLYADRITELHLRQSVDGVWSETFGPGDIDYERLVEALQRRGVRPHLVLEQAVEEGTPHTMGPVEAHRASLAYAAEVFAPLR